MAGRLKATEYEAGNRHEQYSGESERRKVAAQGMGWGAASASTGVASLGISAHRAAGKKSGQRAIEGAKLKYPAAADSLERFKQRGIKVAAKPKTAIAATAGLAATAAGTGAIARFRRNEEQGISQGIGRIKAGSRYDRDLARIAKAQMPKEQVEALLAARRVARGTLVPKQRTWDSGKITNVQQGGRLKGDVGKSLMSNLGMVGALADDPASRKLGRHVMRHKAAYGVGAGVTTGVGATFEGQRRGRKRKAELVATRAALQATPVAKGGRTFAAVGALTGTGGLGTSAAIRQRDKQASNELAAATLGGWGAQGAYQGAGYGAKWRAQAKKEPLTTKSQRNKALKPVKAQHGAYTAAMERNYPKSLPEARTHRILGWTHRGKAGTALGGAATVAGTYAGARLVQPKAKRGAVKKSYGYESKRVSKPRLAEAAVGTALLGWGGSRLGIVRGTLAVGSGRAGNLGIASRRAEKVRNTVEVGTGHGAAMLGRQLNTGFRLRPVEGTVGGALLLNHAMPVRRKEFTPMRAPLQQGGY